MSNSARFNTTAVIWGTYDTGKPRVRILLEAINCCFTDVYPCHRDIWQGVEDKTQVKGGFRKFTIIARWLFAYPILLFRYFRLPRHDYLFIPYMGIIDLLVIYPFARMRGATICLDVFISVYDTAVIDRRLYEKSSFVAKLIYALERRAVRWADKCLTDTRTHAQYIANLFDLKEENIDRLFVGVEGDKFPRLEKNLDTKGESEPITILFYGQFIPLHGIDVIVDAAAILERQHGAKFKWKIIGSGQLETGIDEQIAAKGLTSIQRQKWASYESLASEIQNADICLGIFNKEGKSERVIPNKVFQILAVGSPLITADTPAIRELIEPGECISLVQSGSPEALAEAVIDMSTVLSRKTLDCSEMPRVTAANVAAQLVAILQE
jgi:glycosyltransferase involved in cell wall biosynthesis